MKNSKMFETRATSLIHCLNDWSYYSRQWLLVFIKLQTCIFSQILTKHCRNSQAHVYQPFSLNTVLAKNRSVYTRHCNIIHIYSIYNSCYLANVGFPQLIRTYKQTFTVIDSLCTAHHKRVSIVFDIFTIY